MRVIGALSCAAVVSLAAAVAPTGQDALLNPQKDIELTVSSDAGGESELNFLVLGKDGMAYSWVNYNNGSLQLRSADTKLFEIVDNIPAEKEVEAVLLEKGESSFLENVHSARMRLRARRRASRRQLLATAEEEPETDEKLAAKISARSKLKVTGSIASTASGHVKAYGQRQWKMLAHEDFHQDTVSGWVNEGESVDLPPDNSISECSNQKHTYSDYFLGAFTNMETHKEFLLPPHTHVRVQARVHYIDDWQGESVWMKLNGQIVWVREHSWCNQLLQTMCRPRHEDDATDEGFTINVCGDANFPDQLSVAVDAQIAHSADELKVTFGSNVREGEDAASTRVATWGVDDVIVSVM